MKTMTWLKLKFAAGVGIATLMVGGMATIALSGGGPDTNSKTAQPADPVLIVPGESVGKVRKGMTTNEVEAVLGKPDKWQGRIMVYDQKLGMSVLFARDMTRGVQVVTCGDSLLAYPGVKRFKGRTKEGVGMESTRADVIKALGQPTTTEPWGTQPVQEKLLYQPLGLTFILESGKVMNVMVDLRTAK